MRMKQTPLAAAAVAVTLVTGLSSVRADEKPKVGIAVGVKVNVSDIEARILSDSLGSALREKFDIEVVAGEDAESRLPEGGLPETCIAETECLRTTAESLGVETLLVLVAVRVGTSVQVDTTLFNAENGTSNTRPPVRMTDRERQWRDAFVASATDILPGMPIREGGTTGDGTTGDGTTGDGTTGTGTGNNSTGNGGTITKSKPGFAATRTTLSWALLGATVVGAGATAFFGFKAIDKDNEMPSQCSSDDQCTEAKVATGLFIATAIVGAGFVYTFFFTEKSVSDSERTVGIQAGPGDIGLAIGGRF